MKSEKNAEKLFTAMGDINPRMLEEAASYSKPKSSVFLRLIPAVAAILVCSVLISLVALWPKENSAEDVPTSDEEKNISSDSYETLELYLLSCIETVDSHPQI